MSFCKVRDCRYSGTHVTSGHQCGICTQFGHGQIECCNVDLKNALSKYNDILPDHKFCKRPKCHFSKLHTTESHKCHLCNGFHSYLNCPTSAEFIQRKNNEQNISKNDSENKSDTVYNLQCPTCKKKCSVSVNKNKVYSMDNQCIICFENNVDVFLTCGHVNVCFKCVDKISDKNNNDDLYQYVSSPNSSYNELNNYFLNKYKGIDGKVFTYIYAGMGSFWVCRRNGIGEMIEIHFYHSDDHYSPNNYEEYTNFIQGYSQI
jgi:hypothetical protein